MGRVDSMKKKTMSYFCAGWMGGVGRVDSTIIVNKESEVCVGSGQHFVFIQYIVLRCEFY